VLLAKATAVRGSLKHGPYVDGEGKKRNAKWYVIGAAPERRAERELMRAHLLRRRPEPSHRRWFIPGVGSGTLREAGGGAGHRAGGGGQRLPRSAAVIDSPAVPPRRDAGRRIVRKPRPTLPATTDRTHVSQCAFPRVPRANPAV
jgi:hypothetical protein